MIFLIVSAQQCTCPDVCKGKEELGRGTWKLLHSMVESVERTEQNERLFKNFVLSLQYLYPCQVCRDHIVDMNLSIDSIEMSKRWMCAFHNDVNKNLNKELFNCNNY